MTELLKGMKILMLATSILSLVYAVLYIVFPMTLFSALDYPYYDPSLTLTNGMLLFVIGLFNLRAFRMNDWERVKIYVELAILLIFLWGIAGVWSLIMIPWTTVSYTNQAILTALFFGIAAAVFYFYRKQ